MLDHSGFECISKLRTLLIDSLKTYILNCELIGLKYVKFFLLFKVGYHTHACIVKHIHLCLRREEVSE